MTDPRPEDNPYAPPPAGEPVVPPAPAPQGAPLPPAYQPPAAQPPQYPAAQPPQYPGAPVGEQRPAQTGRSSAKTSSIISLVAGAVSIFLLPYIAGIIAIGTGVTAIRMNSSAKSSGAGFNGSYTGMAIGGIVLGALGIILKLVLDIALR